MTLIERLAALHAGYAAKCSPVETIVARKGAESSLFIYDAIGPESLGGVSAKSVVAALAEAKGSKTLHVRINSIGGSVFEAKAIYTALREFPGKKVVHVDGLAASAASFIAMAGDEIVTQPEATWMIHGAQAVTVGDEATHLKMAEVLSKESAAIRAIYAARTGQSDADLKTWMDAETFMNAEEARARGFTDRIEGETTSTPAVKKLTATAAVTERALRLAHATAETLKHLRSSTGEGGASPARKTETK